MSADSQRLKSALRRIVLESPELRELLGDSDNRGDQAGASGVGTSEAEESRLCCDGSTSDNANPGTDERDADAESQDGLDPDDPADLNSGDGTLSGVTDCATGEPICFDGAGFIPPDGWDEPDDPPIDPGYEEGKYWRATTATSGSYAGNDKTFYALTRAQLEADLIAYFNSNPAGAAYSFCEEDCTGTFECYSANSRSSEPACDSGHYLIEGVGNYWQYEDRLIQLGLFGQRDCSIVSISSVCDDVEPPLADEWPSDGCTNLIIKDGSIVGSKYDPENDGSYSAPMTEIQLCSGTEQIGLKPAANGGWKTINSTTDSGYLYDSHGNKIAHIDGNEYSDPDV